ncbi:hypothetical protein jhhlp_002814 [Lomentospora prolificans]|uniref:Uncharacterized protein n=1 Tax=Lomentospora prolificans TaxID=41688 RepID=A0A2N3NF40_9PEZI|nr:hypothetical protein jhhlp_002814 [Lomentospora prolificans]
MCTKIIYTLPCEHVRRVSIYCPAAPPLSTSSSRSSSSPGSSPGSPGEIQRRTCPNVVTTNIPDPPPPDIDPRTIPECPLLPHCPYEARRRRWNCCWCGKSWNERGRCSCVMLIDGTQYRCDHICCPACEAAPADY